MTSGTLSHTATSATRPLSIGIALFLAAWLAVVIAAARTGAFIASPTSPPLAVLVAIAAPPLLFGLVYRASHAFRAFVLSVDLRWLTAIQAWRVVGVAFLILYAYDMAPGVFAWPAGVGDAAVGLAAPFVLMSILRGAQGWQDHAWWLNVAGLVDFVFAIGTGVLTSESALGIFFETSRHVSLGTLPLSLIPAFAVPLWIIFHVMSFIQLRHIAREHCR